MKLEATQNPEQFRQNTAKMTCQHEAHPIRIRQLFPWIARLHANVVGSDPSPAFKNGRGIFETTNKNNHLPVSTFFILLSFKKPNSKRFFFCIRTYCWQPCLLRVLILRLCFQTLLTYLSAPVWLSRTVKENTKKYRECDRSSACVFIFK